MPHVFWTWERYVEKWTIKIPKGLSSASGIILWEKRRYELHHYVLPEFERDFEASGVMALGIASSR